MGFADINNSIEYHAPYPLKMKHASAEMRRKTFTTQKNSVWLDVAHRGVDVHTCRISFRSAYETSGLVSLEMGQQLVWECSITQSAHAHPILIYSVGLMYRQICAHLCMFAESCFRLHYVRLRLSRLLFGSVID